MVATVKGLTEKQQKVLIVFNPDSVFTKGDLTQITGLNGNQLSSILPSIVKQGLLEEFTVEDDPTRNFHYRLPRVEEPEFVDVEQDELPADTTPEDAAEMPLDLPTTGEMGALIRPDLGSVSGYKNLVPIQDIVAILREAMESDHPQKVDPTSLAIKMAREKFGSDKFGPNELYDLVTDAMGIRAREKMGKPHSGDPIDRAMREELETWRELSKDGDLRILAPDYITANIEAREPFNYLERGDIYKMVTEFLSVEDPELFPMPKPKASDGVSGIKAALAQSDQAKADKANNKPKPGESKPSVPKTNFSSDNAGVYYIRHGEHKGVIKFSAYWEANKKYVRMAITTENMTYHPQIFAATEKAVIEKMTRHFPNAVYNGVILESNTP